MDAGETRSYIEHRLRMAGWQGSHLLSADAFNAIHGYTGGIPRRINALCDRLFLMGYLEEIHAFDEKEVNAVIADMQKEFELSG